MTGTTDAPSTVGEGVRVTKGKLMPRSQTALSSASSDAPIAPSRVFGYRAAKDHGEEEDHGWNEVAVAYGVTIQYIRTAEVLQCWDYAKMLENKGSKSGFLSNRIGSTAVRQDSETTQEPFLQRCRTKRVRVTKARYHVPSNESRAATHDSARESSENVVDTTILTKEEEDDDLRDETSSMKGSRRASEDEQSLDADAAGGCVCGWLWAPPESQENPLRRNSEKEFPGSGDISCSADLPHTNVRPLTPALLSLILTRALPRAQAQSSIYSQIQRYYQQYLQSRTVPGTSTADASILGFLNANSGSDEFPSSLPKKKELSDSLVSSMGLKKSGTGAYTLTTLTGAQNKRLGLGGGPSLGISHGKFSGSGGVPDIQKLGAHAGELEKSWLRQNAEIIQAGNQSFGGKYGTETGLTSISEGKTRFSSGLPSLQEKQATKSLSPSEFINSPSESDEKSLFSVSLFNDGNIGLEDRELSLLFTLMHSLYNAHILTEEEERAETHQDEDEDEENDENTETTTEKSSAGNALASSRNSLSSAKLADNLDDARMPPLSWRAVLRILIQSVLQLWWQRCDGHLTSRGLSMGLSSSPSSNSMPSNPLLSRCEISPSGDSESEGNLSWAKLAAQCLSFLTALVEECPFRIYCRLFRDYIRYVLLQCIRAESQCGDSNKDCLNIILFSWERLAVQALKRDPDLAPLLYASLSAQLYAPSASRGVPLLQMLETVVKAWVGDVAGADVSADGSPASPSTASHSPASPSTTTSPTSPSQAQTVAVVLPLSFWDLLLRSVASSHATLNERVLQWWRHEWFSRYTAENAPKWFLVTVAKMWNDAHWNKTVMKMRGNVLKSFLNHADILCTRFDELPQPDGRHDATHTSNISESHTCFLSELSSALHQISRQLIPDSEASLQSHHLKPSSHAHAASTTPRCRAESHKVQLHRLSLLAAAMSASEPDIRDYWTVAADTKVRHTPQHLY